MIDQLQSLEDAVECGMTIHNPSRTRLPGGMYDQQDPATLEPWLAAPAPAEYQNHRKVIGVDLCAVSVVSDPEPQCMLTQNAAEDFLEVDQIKAFAAAASAIGDNRPVKWNDHRMNGPDNVQRKPYPAWFAEALLEARRLDDAAAREKRNKGNALITLLSMLKIPRDAQIIQTRGEPFLCESTGFTTIRFRKPGVAGEFKVQFKVDHITL